jgi:solute carrier family 35 protein E3
VAAANVLVSALYQVWASTKQRELGVDGMQLLHQIAPPAVLMLGVLVPLLEPVGWGSVFGGGGAAAAVGAAAAATTAPARPTLLTFDYTAPALFWIGLSSVLGLVVTATTFLFIGATSSLTYNVVGHLKTVGIVSAGVLFFREALSARRLVGLGLAMSGIVWYSQVKMQEQAAEAQEREAERRRGGG